MTSNSAEPVNQWQFWISQMRGVLLDTPEKAIDFTEAVIRARYGQAEVEEERPFKARDLGEMWEIEGTNGGGHMIPLLNAVSLVTVRKTTGEVVDYRLRMSDEDRRAMELRLGG